MPLTPRYLRLCQRAGIALADVAAVTGQPLETLEMILAEDEAVQDARKPAGKMMTPLLQRPEMDRWEMRRAER